MLTCITPGSPINIVDFRGFCSNIIYILRGGIPSPIGDFPEDLSQAMLVGIMLVGRLGVILIIIILWETENYHVMWWLLAAFQSGDCFLIYVHSKTITWWDKWLTTITSHDSFSFPIIIIPGGARPKRRPTFSCCAWIMVHYDYHYY